MTTPPKPPRDTPEGSPPQPSACPASPSHPAQKPSELPSGDLPSGSKACSRCHKVQPIDFFMRSAKDRSTKGFRPEEMSVCNKCAFDAHNARAAGAHKDKMPTSERMQKQLTEEEYMELYGAQAVTQGTPAEGEKKDEDNDDDDEVEYAPPEA